jgi:DNA (cytosine-5)-methyltransferase 1
VRYLSLFSGIEAATTAWHSMGWECVGVSEIEPFPCNLLAHRFPHAPNLGDITKITEEQIMMLGQVDLVVFGSPCQDLSVAGKRKGLDGARSGLFFSAMQIVKWLRQWCDLRFALWENVPGAFTSNEGRDFAAVVDALAGLDGTEPPPKGWGTEGGAVGEEAMVEWATLDAQWFGVAQRRRRVFALADFGDWACRPPILLEPESMRGDSAPRRGTGEGVAGALASSTGGSDENDARDGRLIVDRLQRPVLEAFGGNNTSGPIDVSTALNASGTASGRLDFESETFVVDTTQITSKTNRSNPQPGDPCHPLAASGHPPLLTYAFKPGQSEAAGGLFVTEGYAPTLQAINNGSTAVPAVAFQSSQSGVRLDDVHATLDSNNGPRRHNGALVGMQVRRLTPRECERLQGFPDDHTLIAVRGKPAADGPRYKSLGNSMAVPVMAWIGRQIDYAFECF